MRPPGQPAKHCASVRRIARLAKHIAIEHNNCVGSDNNTTGRFGASGIGLAPGQQGWVRGKRHWAGWQRRYYGWRRRVIALFTIVGRSAERLAKPAKQLAAAW